MERRCTKQTTIQAKAVAAAKLVLQDLDPEAKKRRRNFTSGPPQGILVMHIKTLRNFNEAFFFPPYLVPNADIQLYLRIAAQNTVKFSKMLHAQKDSATAKNNVVQGKQGKVRQKMSLYPQDAEVRVKKVNRRHADEPDDNHIKVDELKTFSLELSNNKEATSNMVTFELMQAGDQSKSSGNVGVASLHLFDLIKEMYGYKSVPLMVTDKHIGDLKLEYVFRYGTFGYGYSHELEQSDMPVTQIMNESVFFRLNPPGNRVDDDGLLKSEQVQAPAAIRKGVNNDEESIVDKNKAASSTLEILKRDTSYIDQLIESRQRLDRLKKEYKGLKTRHDRNRYLKQIIFSSATPETRRDTTEADDDSDDLQYIDQLAASENQLEPVKGVIEDVSHLLLMAPGLQSRSEARLSPPSRDDRVSDMDLTERLRKMYDNNAGTSKNTEASRPNSDGYAIREKSDTQSQKEENENGFMSILRKKVLMPMRLNKLMRAGTEPAPSQVDFDVEQGRSSSRLGETNSTPSSEATQPTDTLSANVQSSFRKSILSGWKVFSSSPRPIIAAEEPKKISRPSSANRDFDK